MRRAALATITVGLAALMFAGSGQTATAESETPGCERMTLAKAWQDARSELTTHAVTALGEGVLLLASGEEGKLVKFGHGVLFLEETRQLLWSGAIAVEAGAAFHKGQDAFEQEVDVCQGFIPSVRIIAPPGVTPKVVTVGGEGSGNSDPSLDQWRKQLGTIKIDWPKMTGIAVIPGTQAPSDIKLPSQASTPPSKFVLPKFDSLVPEPTISSMDELLHPKEVIPPAPLPSGQIEAIVADTQDSGPIDDALVQLNGPSPTNYQSDVSRGGGVAFGALPDGTYSLMVVRQGFRTRVMPVSVENGARRRVIVALSAANRYPCRFNIANQTPWSVYVQANDARYVGPAPAMTLSPYSGLPFVLYAPSAAWARADFVNYPPFFWGPMRMDCEGDGLTIFPPP